MRVLVAPTGRHIAVAPLSGARQPADMVFLVQRVEVVPSIEDQQEVVCSMTTSSGFDQSRAQETFHIRRFLGSISPVSMKMSFLVAEVVLVKVQHLNLPLYPYADLVAHQIQQLVAVN